jgi:hypothetical protein
VAASVPDYSGCRIWHGNRSVNSVNRHIQIADGWEALIVLVPDDHWANLEFQRWEPMGRFYLRRLHDDNASARIRKAIPGRMLDLGRAASRVYVSPGVAPVTFAMRTACAGGAACFGE